MPLVAKLGGVKIYIHPFDHSPPHVHVRRAESEMMVDLRTLEVMEGDLPQKVRADVRMWMRRHHDEIIDRWNLAQKGESFDPIEEC